jgi:hypothetical protein
MNIQHTNPMAKHVVDASSAEPTNVIPLRPVNRSASANTDYLDLTVDVEAVCIPYVRFPGTKMVIPDREATVAGFSAFVDEIAQDPAPVIGRKDQVPYYIAGTLREAELVNKNLREQRATRGQSTIGKQRSSAHIESLGPVLLLDDDGDVFAREHALRALGAAAVIYSSHSYGFPKGDAGHVAAAATPSTPGSPSGAGHVAGAASPSTVGPPSGAGQVAATATPSTLGSPGAGHVAAAATPSSPSGDAGQVAATATPSTVRSRGGRVVLLLNRAVTPAEYGPLWDAVNHLLGDGFDEHGRSAALCYGQHARRDQSAPSRRLRLQGVALNADALIKLGRSLRPQSDRVALANTNTRKRASTEELERSQLMGMVRPPDEYGEWVSGAAAFKRAFPGDEGAAFQCFDAWSACSKEYEGSEAARRKFDQVPAEYEGAAAPVTLEMLHWRARRRAERAIAEIYSKVGMWTKPNLPVGMKFESLTSGITQPRGAEPISPERLTTEYGMIALEYLLYCWGEKVFGEIVAAQAVSEATLGEVRRRSIQRRQKIDLAGRILHKWEGKNLSADTAALADAIISSDPELYRVGQLLVRVGAPATDQATAARLRRLHQYQGEPGRPGDPALHAGERLVPILATDLEALREIISAGVATTRTITRGNKKAPDLHEEISSFGFKPSVKTHDEPDAGVLKDLAKRVLVRRVPEVHGVITAPMMSNLPTSTKPDDLLRVGADRIITTPGFDAESGLYYAPLGTPVDVSAEPTKDDVSAAAKFLLEPWQDLPFVSPGEDLDAEVSRSAVVYATMIAANRRGLPIAPGVGISSHGEGMSSGKTLAGEVIGTIVTGSLPSPVSLSTDFTEQRKEIITYLLEGDGVLFLDNIATGTRFDAAPLAAAMTSPRFKGRLLGTNKQVEARTGTMVIANGNSLNMAGDLASRLLNARLDTGLERPEDRPVIQYKITDLRGWVVEHRQQLVAAVHTIVRAYLQGCRLAKGTPSEVAARRRVQGTRFGGQCEVLRDAFLWAFPDLPDPFLSFRASAANSSTKAEIAIVLTTLDKLMCRRVGSKVAPWTVAGAPSPINTRWEKSFDTRWHRLSPNLRQQVYRTSDLVKARCLAWERIAQRVQEMAGRREVRAGRTRFTSAEIVQMLQSSPEAQAVFDGVLQGKSMNPVALGRWLTARVVDAPRGGLVLRSATGRQKSAAFWIERGGVS